MDSRPFFTDPKAESEMVRLLSASHRLAHMPIEPELLDRLRELFDEVIVEMESDDEPVLSEPQLRANVIDAVHSLLCAMSSYSEYLEAESDTERLFRHVGWANG